ncbi:hypothetical protein CSKR_102051 [Clonorchis sinensis]|uniref:Uncharacterized protein n=1 Tax=Clonorchis sinensis TaxID=79923 RepID=A0A419PM61_CLOSI|nr:hypothetical protein CSKR_102051 [Clonorchis sinensis]
MVGGSHWPTDHAPFGLRPSYNNRSGSAQIVRAVSPMCGCPVIQPPMTGKSVSDACQPTKLDFNMHLSRRLITKHLTQLSQDQTLNAPIYWQLPDAECIRRWR